MRYALGVEYDGTAYNGWQAQRNGVGVQTLVEQALSRVADSPVRLICAGRTDAGVHATGQVVHFDAPQARLKHGWLFGGNRYLPEDISLAWIHEVDDAFHARYSALSRTYRYVILNSALRRALCAKQAWWFSQVLDIERMQNAASSLLGEHDFSAFRASGCQARSPIRKVLSLNVARVGEFLVLDITANAFLQNMVRIIVGTLCDVGSGKEPVTWARQVLDSRDRSRGGSTAPAHGLTLVKVDYPEQFALAPPANPRLVHALDTVRIRSGISV